MNDEIYESLRAAFCAELKDIHVSLENNHGRFRTERDMDDAKCAIHAIKDLDRIAAMAKGDKALGR